MHKLSEVSGSKALDATRPLKEFRFYCNEEGILLAKLKAHEVRFVGNNAIAITYYIGDDGLSAEYETINGVILGGTTVEIVHEINLEEVKDMREAVIIHFYEMVMGEHKECEPIDYILGLKLAVDELFYGDNDLPFGYDKESLQLHLAKLNIKVEAEMSENNG